MADRPSRDASRRYPPLTLLVVGLAVALFVLPSALNLPQTNPTQTLEFAPVPPTDDDPPPPDSSGNISGLGLGSTTSAPTVGQTPDGGPGSALPPPPPTATIERPSEYRCSGSPPRQTSDPLAPPCVAFFDGDNGGATHPGVDGDEVRILIYRDAYQVVGSSRGNEQSPVDVCYDLGKAPETQEERDSRDARTLRAWQGYFNNRYQTYERTLHFTLCFGRDVQSEGSVENRVARASQYLKEFDPFATIAELNKGQATSYYDAMINADRVGFGRDPLASAEYYRAKNGHLWSFEATADQEAETFAAHVCQKVAPLPVEFSGNDDLGQQRVYGLIYPEDTSVEQDAALFTSIVRQRLAACGISFEEEVELESQNQGALIRSNGTYAVEPMARLASAGVTTIIWTGGYENQYSKAAGAANYFPEWVVTGYTNLHEGQLNGAAQDQAVWEHARVVTTMTRFDDTLVSPFCAEAWAEAAPGNVEDREHACNFYYSVLRQLVSGIQIAGPNLTPAQIDKGFHAIPPIPSPSAFVPTCFYVDGDYSCVKDAMVMYWDPAGSTVASNDSGCWRMSEAGKRYLRGQWPDGGVDAQQTSDDPCQTFRGGGGVS